MKEQQIPVQRQTLRSVVATFFLCSLLAGGSIPAQALGMDAAPQQSQTRDITVNGTIRDNHGDILPGASVRVRGTQQGTTSDSDGNFYLRCPQGSELEISFIGYMPLRVKAQPKLSVTLNEDNQTLEDVVVVGYGTVKKRDLTGAVTSIKADQVVAAPTGNAMEALQGKVAGLDITKTSGKVGTGVDILLRGSRSIYGDNAPLFIIDGVQGGSMSDVNPSDIETIDVLKDASSTAIYGSAGANGVIIITTKRGKEGKARVNFDAYWGWGGEPNFQHGMIGDEFMTYQREAYKYSHGVSSVDDQTLFGNAAYYQAYQQGKWIDWVDQIKSNAAQQKYSLSVTGGTEKTKIFASAAYSKQDGILQNDNLNTYQMRLNVDQDINKWLSANFSSNISYNNLNNGNNRTFSDALTALPLGDPYDEESKINYRYNDGLTTPLGDFIENQYAENIRTTYLIATGALTWKPIEGLSAKSQLTGILKHSRNGKYRGDQANATHPSYSSTPFAESSNTNYWQFNWENVISYNKTIANDHNLGAQFITSYIVNEQEFARAYSNGVAMDSYQWHQLKAGDSKSYSEYKKWQKLSYAMRFNYSYKGRYLFTFSDRWDGVSWFAEGNKWDSFPAAAFGWRISDEPFMETLTEDWLDNLKLRVGWGITGNAGMLSTQNENGLSDGNAYATQSIPYYFSGTGMRDGQRVDVIQYNTYGSNTLGWEKSYNWNVGLDFGVLKNRISGSVEWFHTITRGLLYKQQMPITSGITMWGSPISSWQNLAKTKNYGVEFSLTTQNIVTHNFTWTTNLSTNWSRESIVSLPVESGYFLDNVNGKNLFEGESINSIYGYKYLGIWKTSEADEAAKYSSEPGFIKIETLDKDGDGGLHAVGADDRQVLGHSNPYWIIGLTNNFTYRGFDLGVHVMARLGQTISSGMVGRYTASDAVTTNQISGADYWTESNQDAYYPRPGSYTKQSAYYTSLAIVDGSFFKVKNITLGYTLPAELTRKAQIDKLRIYFTAYNPMIFCKSILQDTDPETGGSDNFPTYREYVFGINLTF